MAEPKKKLGGLEGKLKTSRVVVVLGAGGVGKTTSAIALALLGAKLGRRVALLSIDPAKRLAAALGIPLGNQLRGIAIPPELKLEHGITGSVDAAMLDQKSVFDAMVRRYAPSDKTAEKILSDRVYQAVSANLAGPLEYMALAKLQELDEDHRYDMIVLDTPPDTHALDFLARPNVLAGFMENKVMSWLIKPFLVASKFGMGRLLNAGEKIMGGIAEVTGAKAIHAFAEWLVLMQEVIGGFHAAGERTSQLLHRPDTCFSVVAVPSLAAARSALHIAEQLVALGYAPGLLVLNRCLPLGVAAELGREPVTELGTEGAHAETFATACATLRRRMAGEAAVEGSLVTRLAAPLVVRLLDQEQEIGSVTAILALAEQMWRAPVS